MICNGMEMTERESGDVWVIYDGECPYCRRYAKWVRLKETVGNVRLINAREDSSEVQEVKSLGYDLHHGMMLKYQGQYFYGADAIHRLALLSTRSGVFNKLNYWVFKSRILSAFLYPLLKFGRSVTLKLLGVKPIE